VLLGGGVRDPEARESTRSGPSFDTEETPFIEKSRGDEESVESMLSAFWMRPRVLPAFMTLDCAQASDRPYRFICFAISIHCEQLPFHIAC